MQATSWASSAHCLASNFKLGFTGSSDARRFIQSFISGLPKAAFAAGALHYDTPPPDVLGDVAELYAGEKFRFANRLSAWIEVVDGRVVDAGYSGRGYMCRTRVRLGRS